uniref:Sulfatase domain-containing protein n=1 Tax=Panagrellus redivivus TaxID=6233 RepID=A0A7E4W0J9_PANRE
MQSGVVIIILLVTACLLVLFIDSVIDNPVKYEYTKSVDIPGPAPWYPTLKSANFPPPLNASEVFVPEPRRNYIGIAFDECDLPHLDPWDPSIEKLVEVDNTPKTCEPSLKQHTILQNGVLIKTTNDNETTCAYRCLQPVNDYLLSYDVWQNITDEATPECDIVETKCFDNAGSSDSPFYEFMHAQVYRNETLKKKENATLPSVHVIIVDSVSHSSFIRMQPRTYYELMSNYEAIPFPHLNKIAVNSRQNALAIFFGKSQQRIHKSRVSVGYESDYSKDADCVKHLDNDQWIGKRFKEAGYTTMMCDDWAMGPFNWPDCKGFLKKATDHMMKPFQLKVEAKDYKNQNISYNVYNGVCKETYETLMEYLDDFIGAYPDEPTFSLTWNIEVAHNNNSHLHHADNYFYNFFKRNEEKLNNSFVFILGDHGLRYGDLRKTPIGEIEDNNPFLLMTLPYSLRNDPKIMPTVRQNARQLITHYDLYATFVDIARPIDNSTTPDKLIMHGSSLLRPLPQPRTCDRLRVPFEHCICQRTKTDSSDYSELGKMAAVKMVAEMNQAVKSDLKIKDICVPLALNQTAPINVEPMNAKNQFSVYKITYSVTPGDGQFWGMATREDGKIKIISARFPRLNAYAKTAFCAKGSAFAAYCYCKSLLKS